MNESLFLRPDEPAPGLPSPRRALFGLLLASAVLCGGGGILALSAAACRRTTVPLPGPRRYPPTYRVKIE